MALDTILDDRTYPEFYLKLSQNSTKTEIWPLEAYFGTKPGNLIYYMMKTRLEQPQAGI